MEISTDDVKNGESYLVTVDDCYGEYKAKCVAKLYKPPHYMAELGHRLRFIDEYNRIVLPRFAKKIETIDG